MAWRKRRPDKAGFYFGRHQDKDPIPCEVYVHSTPKSSTVPTMMIWPVNSPHPFAVDHEFWRSWEWLGPFTVADVARGLRIKKREVAHNEVECGSGI